VTSGDGDQRLEVRSFRAVFDLERRIHQIDRWRIPLPYGLPLRSLGYALATLVALLVTARLPLVGNVVAALPVPVRLVLLPAGAAYLLTRVSVDGRSAHVAGLRWARSALRGQRFAGFRWCSAARVARLDDLTLVHDESSGELRRGHLDGPAEVVLRYPVRIRRRGSSVHVAQTSRVPSFNGRRVRLKSGQRLVVR
jgi:hypothetical protein